MLAAAFDFKLDHDVKDNLVTIGKCKYDQVFSNQSNPQSLIIISRWCVSFNGNGNVRRKSSHPLTIQLDKHG